MILDPQLSENVNIPYFIIMPFLSSILASPILQSSLNELRTVLLLLFQANHLFDLTPNAVLGVFFGTMCH